ncbi:hypothetical protein TWF694_008822 [Orbilia ellipsospora]|uniref:Uncharacterized protein n=1 Tax=Orbilia ellipsospora TaxID=2528407 RepID=A0AAV9XDU6_9PEZI
MVLTFIKNIAIFCIIHSLLLVSNRVVADSTTGDLSSPFTIPLATSTTSSASSSAEPPEETNPPLLKQDPLANVKILDPENEEEFADPDDEPETSIHWAGTLTSTILEILVPLTTDIVYTTTTMSYWPTKIPPEITVTRTIDGPTVTRTKTVVSTITKTITSHAPKIRRRDEHTVTVTQNISPDNPRYQSLDCFKLPPGKKGGGLITQDILEYAQLTFCGQILPLMNPDAGLAHDLWVDDRSGSRRQDIGISWGMPDLKPGAEDCKSSMQKIWNRCTTGEDKDSPKIAGGRLTMPNGVFYLLQAI